MKKQDLVIIFHEFSYIFPKIIEFFIINKKIDRENDRTKSMDIIIGQSRKILERSFECIEME